MRKIASRAVARPVDRQEAAMEWSMALWVLALAFLLVTLQIY